MSTPILVHLSGCLYEMYHFFTGVTPQILRIQFSLLQKIFRKNTGLIK